MASRSAEARGESAGAAEYGQELRAEFFAHYIVGYWRDGGLGGGGHGRGRGPAGQDGGGQAALVQAVGQASPDFVAEAVDEEEALLLGGFDGVGGRGGHGAPGFGGGPGGGWRHTARSDSARRKRVILESGLKCPRRIVQPRFHEVADGAGDHLLVLGGGECQGFAGTPVGLPAALGVYPRDVVRGSTADAMLSGCREAGQGTQDLREGRTPQPGPYPLAPVPVVRLELSDLPARVGLRQARQPGERVPDGRLILLVQVRPAAAPLEDQDTRRPASSHQLRNPRKLAWSFREARPRIAPPPLPLGEPGPGFHVGPGPRIKPQFATRLVAEGLPTLPVHLLARCLRVPHPAQDVADQIHPDQAVEVVGVEAAAPQFVDGGLRHLADRAEQRRTRLGVARDVQPGTGGRPTGWKGQERPHAPVTPVAVMPENAPVHEFDEGAQRLRAIFARAQLPRFDARKVDDGGSVAGNIGEVDRAIDHAAQPDGGAGPVGGPVIAENEQLGDVWAGRREELEPLAIRVRPQDGGGRSQAAGCARKGADRGGKEVEGSHES